MIVVKLKYVDGKENIFTTENYSVGPVKIMFPSILDVKVYVDGKVIKHVSRKFQWFYKKFVYKPVPEEEIPVVEEPQQAVETEEPKPVEEPKKKSAKKTTTTKKKTKKEK